MPNQAPSWCPRATLERLQQRGVALDAVRGFFAERDVLEVETPLLGRGNVPDRHVSGLILAPDQRLDDAVHLQTSPELAMKRLLAAYGISCFQICKAFRLDERGARHNPEFTLVEWYRVGWSHEQLIDEVLDLVRAVRQRLRPDQPLPGIERHLYRGLLRERLAVDPIHSSDAQLVACANQHGAPGVDRSEALDYLMACVIEPSLEPDTLHVIDRYPADQAALARLSIDANGDLTAERFEVYYGPLELANGYGELTDPKDHRRRFEQERTTREQAGLPSAGSTEDFLDALEAGLPPCSGVALGFDRLLMAALGLDRLDDVISFR